MSGLTLKEWEHLGLLLKAKAELVSENQTGMELQIVLTKINNYDELDGGPYSEQFGHIEHTKGDHYAKLRLYNNEVNRRILALHSHHKSEEPRYPIRPTSKKESWLTAKPAPIPATKQALIQASQAAEAAILKSQFVSEYKAPEQNGGLDWTASMEQKWETLKNASQQYIKARKEYQEQFPDQILPLDLSVHSISAEYSSKNPLLGPFRIIHSPLAEVYPDPELRYFHTLWLWVHSNAANPNENVLFALLKKESQELNTHHGCNLPRPDAGLHELVNIGVNLELRPGKFSVEECNRHWKHLQEFAAIKFGPTALLHAYQTELKSAQTKTEYFSNPTKLKALKRACLIVLAATIIAVSVAATVISYGALSPVALMATKIGFGILFAALGGVGAYKGGALMLNLRNKYKAEKRENVIRGFCEEEKVPRSELPTKLRN